MLLLALVTLSLYLPVARHEFLTFDDDEYITENNVVQNGLSLAGLKWAFTTSCASNWHPLTWLSHMADCSLFGLNPGAHHFVNVILHAVNTVLLFVFWFRLTDKLWSSAFIAALFAWHPLHIESVAWVAERKDVLCAFFWMLTLLAYGCYAALVKSNKPQARNFYLLALSFFVLALLSKPMAVTLPCVLLLLDFWPLNRLSLSPLKLADLRPLVVEKIPFFLLTVCACVVTFWAQHRGQAVASLEQVSMTFRLENAASALAGYLGKFFWPAPLAVIYPLAPISTAAVVCSVLLLLGISVIAWRLRRSQPWCLFGWLWFLGTMVPVIGIVQVGSAAMADRYTYLPSIGVFAAIVFGVQHLAARSARIKSLLPVIAGLVLVLIVVRLEAQLRHWRSTETLFRHTLSVTRNNDKAHLNLGITLAQQGRTEEALVELREALRLDSSRYQLHYNIGCLLGKLGQAAEALAEFREAIRSDSKFAAWHCAAGNELLVLGKTDEALAEFAEAIRLKPDYAQPHISTAKFFFESGQDQAAVEALQRAVHAEPERFEVLATAAHYLAAHENSAIRDPAAALKFALKADDLSGHVQPMVLDTLGMAYAAAGDYSNAQLCTQSAIELAGQVGLNENTNMVLRLDLYRRQQPWHESFLRTNAVAH
jgi:tetratricopeptide (TPR) repeat protein